MSSRFFLFFFVSLTSVPATEEALVSHRWVKDRKQVGALFFSGRDLS